MTCVAGIVFNGCVWMAGDSCCTDRRVVHKNIEPKVFQKGEFVIGTSGSPRVAQTIRYKCGFPEHPDGMSNHEYLVTLWVDAVRAALKEAGCSVKKDEEESAHISIMVGYRGQLYELDGDFQVRESMRHYGAIGCGRELALGSLYSSMQMNMGFEQNPIRIVKDAILAACEFDPYVCGPIRVVPGEAEPD